MADLAQQLVPSLPPAPTSEAPELLTQEDYERVKQALTSWRDVLLLQLLRATGLRISEVLRLTPDRLRDDGPHRYVLVRRGKRPRRQGGEWERVYLHPTLGVALSDYVRGLRIKPGEVIFPITDRTVRNIFYRAGEQAIGRRVSPHEFRSLYIKTLIDGGLPVAAAAKMVGHADPKTTQKWYYELTREQRWEIQRRIPI